MTQEEKAKAYDDAIERARIWKDKSGMPKDKQGILDDIFPELKESEDEKIREEILEYFQQFENEELRGVDISDWIAWLEKQGEKKPNPYSGTSFEYNGHTWGMCARDNGVEITIDSELKAFVSLDKSFIYPIRNQPIIAPKSAKEALNEEKVDNANKVEPKFKVRDWIVGNINKEIFLLKSFNSGFCTLEDTEGRIYSPCVPPNEVDYHLWTIKDAKDGDVLYSPSHHLIWIYKDHVNYHACVNMNYVTENLAINGVISTPNDACPATKDEQTILFAKLREVGYTFDFEKNELKKIEQKPNYCHHEVDLSNCSEEYRKAYYDGWNNCNMQHTQLEEEQKSAWSEEDEVKMNRIVACLENLSVADYDILLKDVDWLRTLKNRVLSQNIAYYNPYKEIVESIAEMCKHYDKASHSGLRDFYNNVKVKCKDAKEYDSLFPKSTWKPSDEQMKVCKEVYADLLSAKGFDVGTINSELNRLEEQLKKLREE